MTFICGGRLVPASRFRVVPVAAQLERGGWSTRIIFGFGAMDAKIRPPLARTAYRAAARVRRAVRTAALSGKGPVVVQRLALPWTSWPEGLAARAGRPLVFDFDDAVFLGRGGGISTLRSRALWSVFDAAERVVAGNNWLAGFVPNGAKVTVIPTCIDDAVYSPAEAPSAATNPLIGWIGSGTNLRYLWQLVEPLDRLRKEGLQFRCRICSDVKDDKLLKALGADFLPWTAAHEVEVLRSFDIGLMPLHDDDWCRGKCGFKLIQYMSVGKPVVASAVGFNLDVVREGVDGFLVNSGAWFEPLRELINGPELRARMGSSARERVVAAFSIRSAGQAYLRILQDVC